MHLGVMLNRERRNVRVRYEIASPAGCNEQFCHDTEMRLLRLDYHDVWVLQPTLHNRNGVKCAQRFDQDARQGDDADETREYRPIDTEFL